MIDQYLLRYFLAVAENGNFSRAARSVGVTQPTLSAGIAKLEREVDARLFDRDRQSVALTAAGSRFLVHARRMAAQYEQALQDMRRAPTQRTLRIGILNTIPSMIMADILCRHRALETGENLEMLEGSERDLVDRLDRGRLDMALGVIRSHHTRFRPEGLSEERYLMVLPLDHSLADADADAVTAEELASYPMVVRRHCEALPDIDRFFTQRGVRPRFVLKTNNDARVLDVVRSGLGIGMMPETFDDATMRFIPVEDFPLRRRVGFLHGPSVDLAGWEKSAFKIAVRAAYA